MSLIIIFVWVGFYLVANNIEEDSEVKDGAI